ncbi:MAG: type IV secretion system DNA-binding domain-containing protein [Candidatus Moranbacteria bacterium]|nr:type IV secretion system DNA-binding domain-containing protein [Candidatus Moranbacteria bacterium]
MANKSEIAFFAKTTFRNQERVFGIKTDDRTRHMYIIGKTGMGKTNLLENLVVQDIRNGHGICYIDPHGDTAEKLLKAIPSNRINDVIYLNPSDQNFPLAFNVMESVDPDYRHLVASGLIGVFKKIWADSWGPRLEYILRNAILALLEYPGSTLLGVTRILVDKKYRERVVEKITDPVIRQFWVDEFPKWSDKVLQEVVSPIQNKVGQFLSSSLIRNIVGQTTSSFDIREIMDTRKILIINLSKGRIGEDNGALLGAMMITKIQLAAMGRVDIAEEDRNDFYLYVDEFQNFATESFANILSEARKYRLNLILANQYITQIDEKVRDAIFGNAGTIISFRVGAMDAEFLEKEFMPVFVQNDIVNLPKYNIYLKLMIDGIAGDAFSAQVLPPIYIGDTVDNEEKIIAASRERYASSKEEVEDKISRWAGVMPVGGFQTVNKAPEGQVIQSPNVVRYVAPKKAQNQPSQAAHRNFAPQIKPQQPATAQVGQSAFAGQYSKPQAPVSAPAPHGDLDTQKVIKSQVAVEAFPVNQDDLGEYNQPTPVEKPVVEPVLTSQSVATPQRRHDDIKPVAQAPEIAAVEPVSVALEENPDYYVKPIDERPKFDAVCDMCADHIQIPFQPDGKRPTFCKDCLKEYQRMTAKEKLNQERKIQSQQEEKQTQAAPVSQALQQPVRVAREVPQYKKVVQEPVVAKPTERKIEHKAYVSNDRPMSLSQMQHMAPKQFKPERKRPQINLDEVRQLIDENKKEN